jgi:hypothetical protein
MVTVTAPHDLDGIAGAHTDKYERKVVLRYAASRLFVVAVASAGLVTGHAASGPRPGHSVPSVLGVLGRSARDRDFCSRRS